MIRQGLEDLQDPGLHPDLQGQLDLSHPDTERERFIYLCFIKSNTSLSRYQQILTGTPFSPEDPGGPWGPGLPGGPTGPAVPADPLSPGDPWKIMKTADTR